MEDLIALDEDHMAAHEELEAWLEEALLEADSDEEFDEIWDVFDEEIELLDWAYDDALYELEHDREWAIEEAIDALESDLDERIEELENELDMLWDLVDEIVG